VPVIAEVDEGDAREAPQQGAKHGKAAMA